MSISLSPLPDKLTTTSLPFAKLPGFCKTQARACEDSSAGKMPSALHSFCNAARASASFIL